MLITTHNEMTVSRPTISKRLNVQTTSQITGTLKLALKVSPAMGGLYIIGSLHIFGSIEVWACT